MFSEAYMNSPGGVNFNEISEASHLDLARIFCSLGISNLIGMFCQEA